VFEHGIRKDGSGGCGVVHAHLHVLPLENDVVDRVRNRVVKDFTGALDADLPCFFEDVQNTSYLLFGRFSHSLVLVPSNGVPSQYLRRSIAEEAGFGRWDWREYYGWDDFDCTRHALLSSPQP
jgi:hypothetical protein